MKKIFFWLIFCLSLGLFAQETEPAAEPAAAAESPAEPAVAAAESSAAESPETETSAVPGEGAPESAAPAEPEPAPPIPPENTVEAARLATIRYGTETEIAALIQTLKTEGTDYLDNELVALVETTRNQQILSGVFTFFGDRNQSGLESRAIRAIEERDDETNETVLAAADYLGKVKAGRALDVLMKLLDSQERRFMGTAFRALGRVGGTGPEAADDAAEYLIDYYTNREPGDENRREIITALGAAGSRKGVSFLAEIAGSNEERVSLRIAALEALARIGDAEGLNAVISSVSAADPNVRSSAVAALGPFSGEEVDSAILEAFRDSYYRTRIAAAQASRERKFEKAIPYLRYRAERDDVPAVKDEAIRALGAIGNEECLSIIESLFSERKNADRVRIVAAEMLIHNGPGTYLGRLMVELDEAKTKNQTALYNGFLKIAGEAKTEKLEDLARRFLASGGIIEKSYALDMAANNRLKTLIEEVRALTEDKNASLARKARRVLDTLEAGD
ncbi:MAG: HEAT repeat domain-containing protein [Treponema sp.]|jgi:HEAT repeat protein|nr:HEAT repeat domain-containing protein [Treponema sp.]